MHLRCPVTANCGSRWPNTIGPGRPRNPPTPACGKLTRRPKPSERAMGIPGKLAAILAPITDVVVE